MVDEKISECHPDSKTSIEELLREYECRPNVNEDYVSIGIKWNILYEN